MPIVTKLDRFARDTREALEIIKHLFQNNIKVYILNMGIIDNTPTGQLIFTIFSAFAQFERGVIINRTSEGKNMPGSMIQHLKKDVLKNL